MTSSTQLSASNDIMDDSQVNSIISDICSYWFADHSSTICTNQQKSVLYQALWDSIWFGGMYNDNEKHVDEYIRNRFGHHLEKASVGLYDHFRESPMGSLTLVILFDQFSRNIYRNTPQSYDEKARTITIECIEKRFDLELTPIARAFLYLPLLHSEDVEHQRMSVTLFQQLSIEFDSKIPVVFSRFARLAVEKRQEIEKYGRFPKRNKILGRVSTRQENEDYAFEFH